MMDSSCRAVSGVVPDWRPRHGPMADFSGRPGPTPKTARWAGARPGTTTHRGGGRGAGHWPRRHSPPPREGRERRRMSPRAATTTRAAAQPAGGATTDGGGGGAAPRPLRRRDGLAARRDGHRGRGGVPAQAGREAPRPPPSAAGAPALGASADRDWEGVHEQGDAARGGRR
jgi:hypothetical protein